MQLIPATDSEATEPSAATPPTKSREASKHAGLDDDRIQKEVSMKDGQPRQWNRSLADVRRTHALSIAAR